MAYMGKLVSGEAGPVDPTPMDLKVRHLAAQYIRSHSELSLIVNTSLETSVVTKRCDRQRSSSDGILIRKCTRFQK